MPRLTALPRPFIVNVVTDRSVDAAVATMRLAGMEGAHAHELNLPLLDAVNATRLAGLAHSVPGPVYTSCRRSAFLGVYGVDPATLPQWSDDERMERQLEAVGAGLVAIDMELDTFDAHPAPPLNTPKAERFAAEPGPPAELTTDPAAVSRQRAVIERAHDAGAEVILSCHTGRVLDARRIVAIARTARDRGADLVKIVTPCRRRRDLYAVLDAITAIASSIPIPFTLVGAGPAGLPSRSLGTQFGASYALGQLTLTPGGFHDQPLVAHLRELARLLPWRFGRAEEDEG